MNIRDTIAAINQMQADGVIDQYAIGGAVLSRTGGDAPERIPHGPTMTFDLTTILKSKRDFRQRLAARPIEEKLALLDVLRERALLIRSAAGDAQRTTSRPGPQTFEEPVKNPE